MWEATDEGRVGLKAIQPARTLLGWLAGWLLGQAVVAASPDSELVVGAPDEMSVAGRVQDPSSNIQAPSALADPQPNVQSTASKGAFRHIRDGTMCNLPLYFAVSGNRDARVDSKAQP